ncbi:MAG: hypothetical protein ACFFG0_16560 [Candidatus Thorarchaeota archaeon]
MTTVTGFKCRDEFGFPVICDAFGNNVAIRCPSCAAPILAIMRENQRGSHPDRPATCIACGSHIWAEVKLESQTLIIHRIKEADQA